MAFELPPSVPDDDVVMLHNILTALQSLTTTSGEAGGTLCQRYKVNITPTGYLICAALPGTDQLFEVTLDDMLFLQGLLPARIESVSVGRGAGGGVELFIRVLDARQRVMVTSTTCLWTTRKRVRISTAADT